MTIELKTNTAVRIPVGPLVDPTDGKTAEVALTVTALSVQIYQIKTDGSAVVRTQFDPTASGDDNDMALVTSSTDGMYDLELTAANIDFLGNARLSVYDVDGFLVWWTDLAIVSANYFNNKYGATIEEVDLKSILGTTLTETAGLLAGGFKKFFNIATPTGTIDSIPDAVAGAAGGIAIVGSEMTVPDTQKVDLNTIKTQTVTAGAAVTINPSVGAATIVPTNTQFEARSLLAAAYTVVGDLSNLDTTISSRGTADPGDAMTLSDDAITAAKIATNAIGDDEWNVTSVTTDSASRTASKADVTNLDAAISTRAPSSEYDTEMARITDARMTELDVGTPGKMADYMKKVKFTLCNRWDITEASGNSDIFEDDSLTSFSAVSAAFTTLAGVTLRKKII